MKYFLLVLLTLCLAVLATVATLAHAGDSGLYYDQTRDGEGIVLLCDSDVCVLYLFTYGAETCGEPVVSPSLPGDNCIADGQRWFFAVDVFNEIKQSMTGSLFITVGREYPDGVFGDNPFVSTVGESKIVGRYTLIRGGDGWQLFVTRFGNVLNEDDFLFTRVFSFTSLLFEAVD